MTVANPLRLSFETLIGRSQIQSLEIGILKQLPHQIGCAGTVRADADRRALEVIERIDRAPASSEDEQQLRLREPPQGLQASVIRASTRTLSCRSASRSRSISRRRSSLNELETLSLGVPFIAAFLDPGAWGREFTTALDGYSNMAGMWIVGEDMPQETNRITLSDQKDKWGLPVVDVHFDDHPNNVAIRNHAYGQGKAMYEAVGATRTFPTPPYPSTHNLGTNRMSANARDGVVNKWGQTHDIKNLFISDGASSPPAGQRTQP